MKNHDKHGFFVRNYSASLKFLKESRWYVVSSLAIFCAFMILGFALPIFFNQEIFDFMKELVLKTEGLGVFGLMKFIFLNNLTASFFAIVAGVLLGVFPLGTAIVNGYLLGFVARYAVEEAGGILVLWKLLPHGIFELPAVILSIGFGMKIGFEIWKRDPLKVLRRNLVESMRFFIFVILPLLIIAAIIETFLIFLLG